MLFDVVCIEKLLWKASWPCWWEYQLGGKGTSRTSAAQAVCYLHVEFGCKARKKSDICTPFIPLCHDHVWNKTLSELGHGCCFPHCDDMVVHSTFVFFCRMSCFGPLFWAMVTHNDSHHQVVTVATSSCNFQVKPCALCRDHSASMLMSSRFA